MSLVYFASTGSDFALFLPTITATFPNYDWYSSQSPRPFAHFLCQLHPPTSYENLWPCLETMETSRPCICPLLAPLNYLSCFICQPGLHIQYTLSLVAHIVLYLPSGRTTDANRRFNWICGKTFCRALFHSNCRCTMVAAGGNYSPRM